MELPRVEGGFRCVVADPPWSFDDKGSRIAPEQAPGGAYRTMTPGAIAALDVRSVAARDAILLLWTTSAHLVDGTAARVADAWGFTPKTTMAWVKRGPTGKLQIGMGHYTRAAHELVVLAARGSPLILARNVPSVFEAPRTRHSAKPEGLQDLAERLTAGPFLELFARRGRPGWTCWGDQLEVGEVGT